MSEEASHSLLRSAALASGLLDRQQLDEALVAIGEADGGRSVPLVKIDDDLLADKLVETGRLNRWQAEQLKAGRTRFKLGPYQIIDSIGQGGMGQVFKARHAMMGRVVAVKVLPKSMTTSGSIEAFAHEIRAQAQLDHRNLVRAYDAGYDGNVHYLVTEFVPGKDLRRLVRSGGRLDQYRTARIISQVAAGLGHAHEQGLIHRDVKPGNILVTPDGHAKLSDLGLAGFIDADAQQDDPKAGRIVGTADYLAPELIASPRTASTASDIYSLGCTVYYAVTGKVPFPGGSTREKCRRHCNETPLNPRRFNPDLTDDFMELMADMMEKDPSERVATAEDLIGRLAPWADEAAQTSGPPDVPRWAAASPPPLPPPVIGERTSRSPSSASPLHETPSSSRFDLGFPGSDPLTEESPSQASQRTVPVASAAQETISGFDRIAPRPREKRSRIGPIVLWVSLAAAAVCFGLMVALLIWLR